MIGLAVLVLVVGLTIAGVMISAGMGRDPRAAALGGITALERFMEAVPWRFLIPGLLLLLACGYAYGHPYWDFPVVSHAVCGVRGGQWYAGGLLGPAGCYSSVAP